MIVIVVDLDLLVVAVHHPLDAAPVTIPHGKKSAVIATETMIAIAEGTETDPAALNTGKVVKFIKMNRSFDMITCVGTVTAMQRMSAMTVTERRTEPTVTKGKVTWYLCSRFLNLLIDVFAQLRALFPPMTILMLLSSRGHKCRSVSRQWTEYLESWPCYSLFYLRLLLPSIVLYSARVSRCFPLSRM